MGGGGVAFSISDLLNMLPETLKILTIIQVELF